MDIELERFQDQSFWEGMIELGDKMYPQNRWCKHFRFFHLGEIVSICTSTGAFSSFQETFLPLRS